jgi:hypothetical protein
MEELERRARLVGYARSQRAALQALNHLHTLARADVNFLQPVRRLVQKTRAGARVRKRHDWAQTPYQRLRASGVLSTATAHQLAERYAARKPVRLKLELDAAQEALYSFAARDDPSRQPRIKPGEHLLLAHR